MKKLINILIMSVVLIGCLVNFLSSQKTILVLNEKIGVLDSETISLKDNNEKLKKLLIDNRIESETRHPIDVDYAREFTNSESILSTTDLIEITGLYAKKWEEEIEKYLTLLKEERFSDTKHYVDKSQKQWELSAGSNVELQRDMYNRMFGGGSIRGILVVGARYESLRERALYLKALYDYKIEGNAESYLSLQRSF